jgi:hypothetical protein
MFMVIAVLVTAGVYAQTAPDFKIEFGRVAASSVFKSDTMSIWGGSLVKGEDGLYHLYYSRWPKHLGWVWVTHSEIAHAVSASPFGPFAFKDVTLPPRGAAYWDGLCTHNPTVHRFDGRYYLYYMGIVSPRRIVRSGRSRSIPGPFLRWKANGFPRKIPISGTRTVSTEPLSNA